MKSVKKQIEEIFDSVISCHPSREDDIKVKKAILLIAEEIDTLNGYEIKRDE